MILPKNNRLSTEEVAQLTAIVGEFGCRIQPIVGDVRTIYAIVGDERHELMISRLEGLPFVDRVDTIQSPHKLMDIKSDLSRHRVKIGGVTLGDELLVMAGHCTIDPKNPNLFYETAQAVKEAEGKIGGPIKRRCMTQTPMRRTFFACRNRKSRRWCAPSFAAFPKIA